MTKKGVIFDMDGVLFDTERLYTESWLLLAKDFGVEANMEMAKAVRGSNGEEMVRIIRSFYPDVDVEGYISACLNRVKQIVLKKAPEKEGIHEMLAYLKEKNMKIAVASSTEIESIERNLKNAGIRDYFDVITSGAEVEFGKPAPDVFLLAAERLGIPAEECYVIEDSANGVRAGHASGAATIMVVDLTEPTEELKNLTVGVFDSMIEAMEAMKEHRV